MLRRWVPDAWLADDRPAAVDAAAGALRRGRDGLLLLWDRGTHRRAGAPFDLVGGIVHS